jgi:hypothetical protein
VATAVVDEASDVDAIVNEVEAEVAQRRANHEYPADVLERLQQNIIVAAQEAGTAPEALAVIVSAGPLTGSPPTRFAKRVLRRLLAWYVHPIAVAQTRFNEAVLRDLRRLERRTPPHPADVDEADTRPHDA